MTSFVDDWKSQKAQGRGARNKKGRYKDKSKVIISEKDEIPVLESNSYRYDINDEEESSQEKDISRDFSLLAKASTSQGYFQFKSDKTLFDVKEDVSQESLFQLDLQLLNLSLQTIPFHIRHNLDTSYFSSLELDEMNSAANSNVDKYNDYLKSKIEKNVSQKNIGHVNIKDNCCTHQDKNLVNNESNCKLFINNCKITEDTVEKDNTTAMQIDKDREEPEDFHITGKKIDKDREELENFLEELLDD